tara:strand:- start:58 stop:432 length:375 start_codon:yes stop_codon:yes gene_type:complete
MTEEHPDQLPKFVIYNNEAREIDRLADDKIYYWLKPCPGSTGGLALITDCAPIEIDEELLVKPAADMTDQELEIALQLAESDRITKSDKPGARTARTKRAKAAGVLPNNKTTRDMIDFMLTTND